MQQASVVEMIINKLPDIAKEVSAPLNNISSITMYGDQSTDLIANNTQKIDKILKIAEDSLGIDLKSVVSGYALEKLTSNKKGDKNDNSTCDKN